MKILSLIVCVYVAMLLGYPCQDCGVHAGIDNHSAQDCSGHSSKDENTCHHCSPFCTCNCCQVICVTSIHVIPGAISNLPVPLESLYKEMLSEEVSFSVWQPPKA